jgi:DNA adenine methylase
MNKTCYNGLFRVNKKGEFNVPFGRYKNPDICNVDRLKAASLALQTAEILVTDFEQAVEPARPCDLVYFDPPYVPLSDTSNQAQVFLGRPATAWRIRSGWPPPPSTWPRRTLTLC